MKNDPINTSAIDGASVETTDVPSNAEPISEPSGAEGRLVSGKPWLVRDALGNFRAASPTAADPAVAADVETFERGISESYPNASAALRLMAVRTFAMFRRHERATETAAPRPGGRVPAAVREAGQWADRLTRLIESLEATNSGKRGKANAPRTDLSSLLEAQKRAAQR
jgi:hypothetical protein